jgi:hypothetical protein
MPNKKLNKELLKKVFNQKYSKSDQNFNIKYYGEPKRRTVTMLVIIILKWIS